MGESDGKARLPKQQLSILAICRFAEPVVATSVNPYVPELIRSFNVPLDQVATKSGWLAACFSISQGVTALAWGRASDSIGRKPTILLALTGVMISSVCFGFSSSLSMAFATRSAQGLSSGSVGIIRTVVAELVPERELQPIAFSIMPLVWSIGSIFGPIMGGLLVKPAERYPRLFSSTSIFAKYPFAFPNVVVSFFFLTGIISGILFLRETEEDLSKKPDYGIALGKLLSRACTRRRRSTGFRVQEDEQDPFLGGEDVGVDLDIPSSPIAKTRESFKWSKVLTRQSVINLMAYTGLALHSIAFDQILPVFFNYPPSSEVSTPINLPLRFSGGFGLDSARIGLIFTVYGIFCMFIQFFVFPPMAKRYGVLRCFKVCAVLFPPVYILVPFTALLKSSNSRQFVCLLLMMVKGVGAIFAFPCTTILLTNSASSLKVLGTLNGISTAVSALGRATGPALVGATFTAGVDAGFIIAPFWLLAALSILAAFPIWWLVESDTLANSKSADTHGQSDSQDHRRNGQVEPDDDDIIDVFHDDPISQASHR